MLDIFGKIEITGGIGSPYIIILAGICGDMAGDVGSDLVAVSYTHLRLRLRRPGIGLILAGSGWAGFGILYPSAY